MKAEERQADAIGVIADKFGVSKEYVRLIVIGDRSTNTDKAKAIKRAYNEYVSGKNKLIRAVEKLVKL